MGLDIRWPIGLMFTLIGLLLAIFGGLKADDSMTLGININLVWGVALVIFGGGMLFGAIRGQNKAPDA